MREFLLGKLKETQDKIQKIIVDKINLAMAFAWYKKLDKSKQEYDFNVRGARRSIRTIMTISSEILVLIIFLVLLNVKMSLFFKVCIGGLCVLDVVSFACFFDELRKIIKGRRFLMENGYDPEDEEQMDKLKENKQDLKNKYKEDNAYLDELTEKEEDLQSMIDSNDLSYALEKYPELLEECLGIEFNEYLDELKNIRPEDVDFKPVVEEEDLRIDNLHQLKLK